MKIHIERGDIHRIDLRTRMPFKYGIATMTETPHVFVRLWVQVDGKLSSGIAADHLPPKWFTKNPDQPIAKEIDDMLRVIKHAVRSAAGVQADSPFDAWLQLADTQSAWGRAENLPALLTQFGASLVERAMIEAVCRAAGRPFHELLVANAFGVRLGHLHPELAGRLPAEFLPTKPLERITARHTVGLLDPLTDADIPANERLDDGLPQSLTACIRTYSLRHFKIKVSGQPQPDAARLHRIAEIIKRDAPTDFAVTLDGNEQFRDMAEFHRFWDELRPSPTLRQFFEHLLFVEQPIHRKAALAAAAIKSSAAMDGPDLPPLIIDESDAERDSLPRALALGYNGTSHKNCKGVFKSVGNACLIAHLRRASPGITLILSGEDLANIGPVALLQDLAVCAALGIESVERNGHHYFAGLSMFPDEVQRQMLEAHGDLYQPSRDGWPTLAIRDGRLDVRSVNAAPFGVGIGVDVAACKPVDLA